MISGSIVVPFQKGPCGEGKAVLGFLLPLVEVVVDALVLFIILFTIIKKKNEDMIKNIAFVFALVFGRKASHSPTTVWHD